jgi:hypothetical protein
MKMYVGPVKYGSRSMRYHSAGCTNDIKDPVKRIHALEKRILEAQTEILNRTLGIHIMIFEIEQCKQEISKNGGSNA